MALTILRARNLPRCVWDSCATKLDGIHRQEQATERVLGGAIARGHPYGAAGAVLVARLFTRMARGDDKASLGVATLGVMGGMGLAALFEAV